MLKPWQFGKPKGPGFGMSAHYYLSVLAPTAVLPSVYSLANPKGEDGAIEGFGAPLRTDSKEALQAPMTRGAYVLASKDRKTVIKMLVLHRDETQFDPEAFARSELATEAEPELVSRVRGAWYLIQLAFETYDPELYPAVRFMLRITQRLAILCDGAVADPVSQRYSLPEQILHEQTSDFKMDARDFVSIRHRDKADGRHVFTLGMQKFVLPELEMQGCLTEDTNLAGELLLGIAQGVLNGSKIKEGGKIGSAAQPFDLRVGGLDRGLWEGITVLELVPPFDKTAPDCLAAWFSEKES